MVTKCLLTRSEIGIVSYALAKRYWISRKTVSKAILQFCPACFGFLTTETLPLSC